MENVIGGNLLENELPALNVAGYGVVVGLKLVPMGELPMVRDNGKIDGCWDWGSK